MMDDELAFGGLNYLIKLISRSSFQVRTILGLEFALLSLYTPSPSPP